MSAVGNRFDNETGETRSKAGGGGASKDFHRLLDLQEACKRVVFASVIHVDGG